jgi:hypothetical protein
MHHDFLLFYGGFATSFFLSFFLSIIELLVLNSCLVRKVFFVVFTNQREAKDIPKKKETQFEVLLW